MKNEKELEFRDRQKEIIEEAYHKFCEHDDVVSAMEPWIRKTALPYDRKYPGATKIVTPQPSLQEQIYNLISRGFGWGQKTFNNIQAAINALHNPHPGGLVWIKEGVYEQGSTLIIPKYTKSLTLTGAAGYGKSDQNFGSMVKAGAGVTTLLKIDADNDVRSAYGINFHNIKFVGLGTIDCVGLKLTNLDTGVIAHCTFLKFGTSVKLEYQGSTFPLGEQPGKVFIHNCEFAEGQNDYIFLDKCTQTYIHDCCFESFGPFKRILHIRDSNKIHVGKCEFNKSSDPSTMTEFVRVEASHGSPYVPNGILLNDDWAYRYASGYVFLRTVGASKEIYNVLLEGNLIEHGYSPNETTDTGPYVIGDESYHQVNARDCISPFSSTFSRLRDNTSAWGAGVARQNKWSPMLVYLTVNMDVGGTAQVQMASKQADLFTVLSVSYNGPAGTQEKQTMTFEVPSLFWWKVIPSSASQTGLIVLYW